MHQDVQQQLLSINRSFYERFACAFAQSRSAGQASLRRALERVGDGAHVLDVGCGDGRVARTIEQMGRRAVYVGLDASTALLALARARAGGLTHVTASFVRTDITTQDWTGVVAGRSFDAVLSLAVLHHIPGHEARQRLLVQMAALLTAPGCLIISTWQFMSSERLRRKIVPWSAVGLAEHGVDEGDYLLDWQRGGYGLRYCHLIGEDELRRLCRSAGLVIADLFLADNGLNLYAVAHKP